ncbi:MAG: hypothetical protein JXP34_10885 [Planctomycetes bacterium]|nr:hypothetical protein [Planctomycetota bacterium]
MRETVLAAVHLAAVRLSVGLIFAAAMPSTSSFAEDASTPPPNEPKYIIAALQGVEDDARTSPILAGLVEELKSEFGAMPAGSTRYFGFSPGLFQFLNWTRETLEARVNQALDIAERTGMPVFFHLDDEHFWYRRTELTGDPEAVEWSAFPSAGERHGPVIERYWLNWGRWVVYPAPPPCFESPKFRAEVKGRLEGCVAAPIIERLERWKAAGRDHLFAGIAVGNETMVPDWRGASAAPEGKEPRGLEVTTYPPAEVRMERSEMVRAGYAALHHRGYTAASIEKLAKAKKETPETITAELLFDVAHDYSEFMAKTLRDAGMRRGRIHTHFTSPFAKFIEPMINVKPDSVGTAGAGLRMPPVRSAMNPCSRPGFTVARDMVDLSDLTAQMAAEEDGGDVGWAVVESYCTIGQPGETQTREQYEEYLGGLFACGARLVNLYGWNVPRENPFSVQNAPGVKEAIRKWLGGKRLPDTWRGRTPSEDPSAGSGAPPHSLRSKADRFWESVNRWRKENRDPSPVAEIMKDFEPLLREGKFKEAEAVLDRALEFLGAGENTEKKKPPSSSR